MRHGHSLANEKGIIISDPPTGTCLYGLSERGKSQVISAAQSFTAPAPLIIYSSDFLRTAETARLLGKELKVDKIFYSEKLRERFFGEYEGKSVNHYNDLWERDALAERNNSHGVENPSEVALRTGSLIGELEIKYSDASIILVSHGDSLQILQTLFYSVPPETHRSLIHLETAEIREMKKKQR